MRRLLCLLLVLSCLAPAAASAQLADPFGTPDIPTPIPTAPQIVVPTPTATNNADDGNTVSRGFLLGVAGVIALIFLGIGIYVSRDARRSLTEADRRAVDRERAGLPPVKSLAEKQLDMKRKQQSRAKGKAQRQARKAGRRR